MFADPPFDVAIVDDDDFQNSVIKKMCSTFSWVKPVTFTNPVAALEHIFREKIRIVFLDINMPGMYGDDVLRQLMALKLGIQAYVITGSESMVIADRCLNIGARIVIPKPIDIKQVDLALTDARIHLERCRDTVGRLAKKRRA